MYITADGCVETQTYPVRHSFNAENPPLGLGFVIPRDPLAGSGIITHLAGEVEHVVGAKCVAVFAVGVGALMVRTAWREGSILNLRSENVVRYV